MSFTGPSTATTGNVTGATVSTTLFSAATNVYGRNIYNDSTAVLYVKYGATASTSSYTVQVAAGGYFEFPQPPYSGQVDGIWSAVNGTARTTAW